MEAGEPKAKLSELMTQTTLLYQAQNGTPEQADAAKQLLMLRYSGAVHRYLLKVVGDPEAARDLNQEFSVKFLEGKFRHFDPSRGRFRDYLKRALHNLMVDHFRKRQGAAQLDTAMEADIVGDDGLGEFDRQFLISWRQDLLARAWDALRAYESNTGKPFHEVMRLRLARPKMRSPELAEELAARIGRRQPPPDPPPRPRQVHRVPHRRGPGLAQAPEPRGGRGGAGGPPAPGPVQAVPGQAQVRGLSRPQGAFAPSAFRMTGSKASAMRTKPRSVGCEPSTVASPSSPSWTLPSR